MATANAAQTHSPEMLLSAISEVDPILREEAFAFDDARQLSDRANKALRDAGVFRFAMPRDWGGPEYDPVTQLRAVEAVSRIDGAAGWCAMIGSDGAYLTSFLEDSVGRQMYSDLDASSVFVVGRGGVAAPVKGGYSVSGRWPFASGSPHAEWFALGCVVPGDTGPRMTHAGMPEIRICVLHRSEVATLDTWFTTGVRGSGSHDVTASDIFVPDERTFWFNGGPVLREGRLYAWPMMFIANMAGVPLGIAAAAFEEVITLSKTKATTLQTPVREEAWFSAGLGEAAALIWGARAFAESALAVLWEELNNGGLPTAETRARHRISMTHAFDSCTRAVDLLYRISGSAALYTTRSGLDRKLRDIHAVSQHGVIGLKTYSQAGRLLVGLEAGPMF